MLPDSITCAGRACVSAAQGLVVLLAMKRWPVMNTMELFLHGRRNLVRSSCVMSRAEGE